MIKANFKGFYFFDWEIKLLKEIGFEFPKLKEMNRLKYSISSEKPEKWVETFICTYKVLENPKSLELTQKRKDLLYQLRFQMNDINVIIPSDKTGFRQIEIS